MDAGGNIYELTEKQTRAMEEARDSDLAVQAREDVARLDGFLRGAAQAGRKAHERLVHDSTKDGTYRKPGEPS